MSGIAAEAAGPEAVAEDDDAVPSVSLVVCRERAAEAGLLAEDLEEARRHALPAQLLGLCTRLAQREHSAGDRRDRFEDLLACRPVHVVLRRRTGERERVAIGILRKIGVRRTPLADCGQAIVLVEGETAQHDRIDHGKDRGAGADAQGQHQQSDSRERL